MASTQSPSNMPNDGLASRTFELDNEGKQAFTDFIAQVEPLTIHSQEATLEQIFIKLTGGLTVNRVMSLLRQDFKLLLRNALFWVLTVALVLIVVTVWYLIPREQTGFETRLAVYGMEFPGGGVEIVASPGKVEQMVREKGVLGIVREDGALTVVHDGLSKQAVTAFVAQIMPPQTPLSPIQIELRKRRNQFHIICGSLRYS